MRPRVSDWQAGLIVVCENVFVVLGSILTSLYFHSIMLIETDVVCLPSVSTTSLRSPDVYKALFQFKYLNYVDEHVKFHNGS